MPIDDGIFDKIVTIHHFAAEVGEVAAEDVVFLILVNSQIVVVVGSLKNCVVNLGIGNIQPADGVGISLDSLIDLFYQKNPFDFQIIFGFRLFLRLGAFSSLGAGRIRRRALAGASGCGRHDH